MMRLFELPLLGSNQDSSDPESDEGRTLMANSGSESRPNIPEAGPNDHGSAHTSTPAIATWLLPPYAPVFDEVGIDIGRLCSQADGER